MQETAQNPLPRLNTWLAQFVAWHESFKKGEFTPELAAAYLEARADLNAILVLAQNLELRGGMVRKAVRVARAVPVELAYGTEKVSALTHDISVSGLSAIVGNAPEVGTVFPIVLKVGRGEAVTSDARVVACVPLQGAVRIALMFQDLSTDARLRIETLVFDSMCAEIRFMLRSTTASSTTLLSTTAVDLPTVGE